MKQWHVKNFDLGYTIDGIRNILIKRMASPYQSIKVSGRIAMVVIFTIARVPD